MAAPANGSLLILDTFGVPLYSARNLTQTFSPIPEAAQLERDLNGGLIDLSWDGFKKYSTRITCTDFNSPALDGVWPGTWVTIGCIPEFCFKTAGGTPSRTVVFGSMRTKGDFTFYRPLLDMAVLSLTFGKVEYPGDVNWTLEAVER